MQEVKNFVEFLHEVTKFELRGSDTNIMLYKDNKPTQWYGKKVGTKYQIYNHRDEKIQTPMSWDKFEKQIKQYNQ